MRACGVNDGPDPTQGRKVGPASDVISPALGVGSATCEGRPRRDVPLTEDGPNTAYRPRLRIELGGGGRLLLLFQALANRKEHTK